MSDKKSDKDIANSVEQDANSVEQDGVDTKNSNVDGNDAAEVKSADGAATDKGEPVQVGNVKVYGLSPEAARNLLAPGGAQVAANVEKDDGAPLVYSSVKRDAKRDGEEGDEEVPPLDILTEVFKTSACERRVRVTIPRFEIERYYDNEYKELANSAYVPGFRVGKAPRKLVERRFRKEIGDRVKHLLVVDALSHVTDNAEFTPISEPDLNMAVLVLPEVGDFVFEFSIEVRPDFELPEWKGLKINRPVREFTSEDVDRAVKRLLTRYSDLEDVDGPAQLGDYIEADVTIRCEDAVLNEVEEESFKVCPQLTFHDGVLENFGELATGAKKGDTFVAKTTLSADAPNEAYREKTVEIEFRVKSVQRETLPHVTEAFLQRLGFDTEADMRDAVLDSLKRQLEHEQHRSTRRQITEQLTVTATWELPQSLLKKQVGREIQRTIMEMQRNGYSHEELIARLNAIRQNSAINTAQSLKEHFILEKIAEIEKVEDTPEDYDDEISLIAAQHNISPRRVRAQIEKEGHMDILRNQIIERKVLNMISENAVFTDTPFEWNNSEREDVEAVDWPLGGEPDAIEEATKEDLKAVHLENDEKKRIDPNARIT